MKPTPTDLALIAAMLSKDGKTPQDKLPEAKKLWQAAQDHISHTTGRGRFIAAIKISPGMSLEDFLKAKLPTIKTPSLRQRRFHQYLVESYLPKQTKGKPIANGIDSLANEFIAVAQKGGVSISSYPDFVGWCRAKKSVGKAVGAKAMHQKRVAAKEAEEIRQAASRKASEKKSRIEYHDPAMLAAIAEKEQRAGGGSLQD